MRERRGGEEDYILQRSAPRVNLPHGPLRRVQYETMIKKKLLYSPSYQYNSLCGLPSHSGGGNLLLQRIFFSPKKKKNLHL